jgi:hypothetical protein
MSLVKKILAETIETSLRVLPMIADHLLEVKGEMVYQRIKTDIALSCLPNPHNAVVIDTKTEEWKTAENLVYAQQKINEMQNPSSCYLRPLDDLNLFFDKYLLKKQE